MDLAAAENLLLEWSTAGSALALLRTAHGAGFFARLAEPAAPEEVAGELGLDVTRTRRVCMALEALQILRREGSAYRLAEGWAEMNADDRPATLGDRLAILPLVQNAVARCLEPSVGFDAVPPEEAVTLANSVWGVPSSPAALESWAALDEAMPEVRAVWRAGCRHAEFGCGAGRDLLRIVVMYPRVEAVGYECLPHVVEPARRLAASLGVETRVEFRLEDVRNASARDEFDTIVWSQMFFPPAGRSATIASLRRALKPAGFLIMPLMPDLPAPEDVEPTLAMRFLLLTSLAYARWDIHWPASHDVRAELERAGFLHLHTIPHTRTPFMVMRGNGRDQGARVP